MSPAITNTVEIDVRGFVCPSSLLVALRELNKQKDGLRRGDIRVVFLVDNHESTNRICEAVKSMGYEFEVTESQGGYSVAVFRIRSIKDGYI